MIGYEPGSLTVPYTDLPLEGGKLTVILSACENIMLTYALGEHAPKLSQLSCGTVMTFYASLLAEVPQCSLLT